MSIKFSNYKPAQSVMTFPSTQRRLRNSTNVTQVTQLSIPAYPCLWAFASTVTYVTSVLLGT